MWETFRCGPAVGGAFVKLRREDSAPTSIRNALLVGVGRAITVTSLVILSAWAIGAPDLNPPPRTYHMEVVR